MQFLTGLDTGRESNPPPAGDRQSLGSLEVFLERTAEHVIICVVSSVRSKHVMASPQLLIELLKEVVIVPYLVHPLARDSHKKCV